MVVNLGFTRVNYTGPYISDGKFQTSVKFGKSKPLDRLDGLSRLHDSAFSEFKDYGHRAAANEIYYKATKNGNGVERVSGIAVQYGNQLLSAVSNLFGHGMPDLPRLVYGGIKNGLNLHDYMINGNKYKNDVLGFYSSDPHKSDPTYMNPNMDHDTSSGPPTGVLPAPDIGIGGRRVSTGRVETNHVDNTSTGFPADSSEYSGGGPAKYDFRLSRRPKARLHRVWF